MTYTGEDQDESKLTLKSYKPLFEETTIATKGVERVMNSEQGVTELVANEPAPAGTIPSEMQLQSQNKGGGIFGGEGGGGSGGGNMPVADEQTVEADFDHYDRMRLWFKKYFGYRIKPGKDVFDWLRDKASIINVVLWITAIAAATLLIIKKKYILAAVAGLSLILLKLVFPVVQSSRR